MSVVTTQTGKSRTERIKERIVSDRPRISIQRAVYITEAYAALEREPIVLKSAKALDYLLKHIGVRIFPDELIAGSQTELSRGAPLFPEYTTAWILKELDTFPTRPIDKFEICDKDKKELARILGYWKDRTVTDRVDAAMSGFSDIGDALETGILICRRGRSGTGHIIPDYETVLREGLTGIGERAGARLDVLDYSNPSDERKIFFLQAVKIVCESVSAFAARYAAEAGRLADAEKDPERKAELRAISQNCARVPAYPARTFWEALQSLWFTHLAVQIESHGHSISLGRIDRYLFPFYARDLGNKTITAKRAEELVDCLWLKINEIIKVRPEDHAKVHAGYPVYQGVTLGGQDKDGNDDTNELSSLCLDSTRRVGLPQPTMMIRVNANTPENFLAKAHEVSTLGMGIPVYTNDDVAIAAMLARGITLEDARRYGLVGCWELQPEGKSETAPYGGYVNMAKILEVALFDGKDHVSGKAVEKQGDGIETYDALLHTFEAYLKEAVKQLATINNMGDLVLKDTAPLPFLSCLVEGCVEKGKPLVEGGAVYNFTSLHAPGVATVADSLAAIKRLVFEERTLGMDELKKALETDFEGKENVRMMLMNRAPKFGNDDECVDGIARHISVFFCNEVEKYPNARGGRCWPGLWGSENSIPMGMATGATPDGRKAGMPLADGCSPSQGKDLHGPTAVIRSVSKIDHILGGADGTQLNMKFSRSLFDGKKTLGCLVALTKTFFGLKGESICYFIVDSDVLRDAQKHPDRYSSLVVRVAGYSAFFTQLSREIQDDLIARTEHKIQ
jgi:pyruvate formate-lyase/glycerol dehydratase family glycyl radical enzyme